ncbi:MAG: hypothetical protein GX847_06650 [Clostridiales bacterium]|nr:hypothetical protein [Clostridiales bacterium]
MKKNLALFMAVVLAAALFAGCGTGGTTPSASPSASAPTSAAPTGDVSEAVKTGLAVINSIAKSADAGEKDGLAQADSLIVALTVGADGKIVSCVIDAAQSKVSFNAKGELITPLDAEFKTKNELGAEYGMGKASDIGMEWNAHAAAFAAYVTGKTLNEVKGIAVNEEGVPTEADLTASVTVHVTDFIAGIEKAAAGAQELGASKGDVLNIATSTNIANSKNAAGDTEGLAQVYSTYAALTRDGGGKITSCIFDASQSNVSFDATGKITTDLTVAPQTKNELSDAYGMRKASDIGKEWNEQAAAFAAYITGKTAAEAAGIAVSEGYAGDADLKASVTIHITDFLAVIAKAAA